MNQKDQNEEKCEKNCPDYSGMEILHKEQCDCSCHSTSTEEKCIACGFPHSEDYECATQPFSTSSTLDIPKGTAYSPEITKIRPILAKYMSEWSNEMLCELATLLSKRDAEIRKVIKGMKQTVPTEGKYQVRVNQNMILDELLAKLDNQ